MALSTPSPFIMTIDTEQLTQEALDAFWEVIARRYPAATTGDLSPHISSRLTQAAKSAINEWVSANVPKHRRQKAALIASPDGTHTPGPWSVHGTEMDCARFWIWASDKSQYIGSVGLLDDSKRTDYGNARLIAAAPDLRVVVQTAKSAFGERLSCLRDERREVLRFDGDAEDIDDQIGHYEALIAKCTAALEKTTAG